MEEQGGKAPDLLVEVRDLTKHYGSIKAVDGVSFSVRRGDVLGFLGPNGAGKTTAMKMITGFLEPDNGQIQVAGFDVATEGLESRRRVGYLPENAPAYGEMTVEGFLDFIAEARSLPDRSGAVRRVVEMTGLNEVFHQTVETLSKGFKRRVGLAQALIHDPEVLILDEPTDGLDPNQKAVVHGLIESLAAEKAIILSTHILDEVEQVCNRALIISGGRVLEDSTPRQLIARAPHHNVIRVHLNEDFLASEAGSNWIQRLREQPWCGSVESSPRGAIDAVPADGANHLSELLELLGDAQVEGVQLLEGRLDDLFRSVTKGVAA
ncbi:MAG: ABC transporter ATP-binding protein [Deltaproteobacteria bacterium]|nr:ABC transporter ATP-binding protein [Deltaproteobacteria bacterium]